MMYFRSTFCFLTVVFFSVEKGRDDDIPCKTYWANSLEGSSARDSMVLTIFFNSLFTNMIFVTLDTKYII